MDVDVDEDEDEDEEEFLLAEAIYGFGGHQQ